MKAIEIKKRSKYDDIEILRQVCSAHGDRGINIGTMRTLIKVLDKLETAKDELLLEDEEYNVLRRHFESFNFAIAHRDITELHDAITTAKATT